jgi:hypothetical protein
VSAGGARAADQDARREAVDRLERFATRLEHVSAESLRQVALPNPDSAERRAFRERADALAREVELATLVDDTRGRLRDYVMQVYAASNYRPVWAGLNWVPSMGPVSDRLGAIAAVQDAGTAAIIEPFAPDELVADLAAPFELIVAGATTRDGFDTPQLVELRRVPGGPLVGSIALVSLGVTFVGLLVADLWIVVLAIVVALVALLRLAARRQA